MKANIKVTQVKGSTDKVYRVRSGKQGMGRVLYSCTAWNNPQATTIAYNDCCEWLIRKGFTLVNKEGNVVDNHWEGDHWEN